MRIRYPSGFGAASVRGLSASEHQDAAETLRQALADHAIIHLAFDHPLTDTELRSVASLFGPIKDRVGRTKEGGRLRYDPNRQVIDSGKVVDRHTQEENEQLDLGGLDDRRPGLFETYHCDDTYTERPASATVLHARALPARGGGPTCFLDMRRAYALLEPSQRQRLEGLRVVYAYNNEDAFASRRSARGTAEALVDVVHPLVRRQATAGSRSLYLDLDRAKRIEGMSVAEGRSLLEQLQLHAEQLAPEYEHHWQEHDVLVWDNASVQHKAKGDFAIGEPRQFWRYLIEGEVPRA